MAPLPPSNTTRYFLDYTVDDANHTLEMRCDAAVTDSEASTHIGALLGQVAPYLHLLTVVGLRRAEEGSNVSLPAVWSGDASYGTGAANDTNIPYFLSFTGRGSSGRRVRVTIFGYDVGFNDNYRLFAADDANVTGALAELATTDPVWLNINGDAPFWNQYANIGANAYWQRKART